MEQEREIEGGTEAERQLVVGRPAPMASIDCLQWRQQCHQFDQQHVVPIRFPFQIMERLEPQIQVNAEWAGQQKPPGQASIDSSTAHDGHVRLIKVAL